MCIGIPMQVVESWPGVARVTGRGKHERLDTRLIGEAAIAPGTWLLAFQGAAREILDAARAAEIDAALDLLDAAMAGDVAQAGSDPGFKLPSMMSAADLARLAGAPNPQPVKE